MERREIIQKVKTLFPLEGDFLAEFNHTSAIDRYEGINTIAAAYNPKMIKVCELKHAYSEDTPRVLIEFWLIQLIAYFELPMNKGQIVELARYIYEDLYMLNLPELTLFFKWVKKGKYGSFYGRVDPAEISRWCREFRQERGNYISKLPNEYESEVIKKAKEEYLKGVTSPPAS